MNIIRRTEKDSLVLELSGKLYTPTAALLQNEVNNALTETKNIVLDFTRVDFLASSGLRVLLAAQKQVSMVGGDLILRHVNHTVMSVLEITGFNTFLTIE